MRMKDKIIPKIAKAAGNLFDENLPYFTISKQ
jgi:hypothetical protein